jgi:phosphotransferase system HPr (HPr) family protein
VYTGPIQPTAGKLPAGHLNGSQTPQDVMSGEALRRVVTVANPQGLHMRPAAAFAKAARQYASTVTVTRDDRAVNGKSQIDLLLLAAEPGAQLTLEVSGEDATAALDALGAILESVFEENDEASNPPPKG